MSLCRLCAHHDVGYLFSQQSMSLRQNGLDRGLGLGLEVGDGRNCLRLVYNFHHCRWRRRQDHGQVGLEAQAIAGICEASVFSAEITVS